MTDVESVLRELPQGGFPVLDSDAPAPAPRSSIDHEGALAEARRTIAGLVARNEALSHRLSLRSSIEACSRASSPTPPASAHLSTASTPSSPEEPPYLFDAPRDTGLAHEDPRFRDVCHVFHQEWLGIRSAAGVLPGHKLAIRSDRRLRIRELEQVVRELDRRRVRVVILHAWSDTARELARILRSVTSTKLLVVWHGTTTQWAAPEERRLALDALTAAREGLVHEWRAIRRGMESLVEARRPAPQLLNAPPNVRARVPRSPRRVERCVALAPSWNDLRKNLVTNLLAAQAVPRIERTLYFAGDLELPTWLAPRLERRRHVNPRQTSELMGTVDLVLNATTIDCHPMVDLEALAVGTPAIRGPLFLDALDDHEYARETVVENVLSVADVARAIERVLSLPHDELDGMLVDYRSRLRSISLDRYAEFVGA